MNICVNRPRRENESQAAYKQSMREQKRYLKDALKLGFAYADMRKRMGVYGEGLFKQ